MNFPSDSMHFVSLRGCVTVADLERPEPMCDLCPAEFATPFPPTGQFLCENCRALVREALKENDDGRSIPV
jgi:hypothetical protein